MTRFIKKKLLLITLACILFLAFAGYYCWRGYKAGEESGARQMARHLLNPMYHTDKFLLIAKEEATASLGTKYGYLVTTCTCGNRMVATFLIGKPYIFTCGRCGRKHSGGIPE